MVHLRANYVTDARTYNFRGWFKLRPGTLRTGVGQFHDLGTGQSCAIPHSVVVNILNY